MQVADRSAQAGKQQCAAQRVSGSNIHATLPPVAYHRFFLKTCMVTFLTTH